MKKQHISVLSLVVLGATSAYSQITLNPVPERAVGTPALTVTSQNPNLVEGREFFVPQSVALDNSVSPPIIYVADYFNNRVLSWRNSASFTTGQKADLVIGQPDFQTTFPQGPGGAGSNFSRGLTRPTGIAVDKSGNLYVADSGNNRVLRYRAPYAQTDPFPVPDLFLGQANITGHAINYPNGATNPRGLYMVVSGSALLSSITFDSAGNLWVVDPGNSRVIRFNASDLAGTGGGIAADLELGQLDLNSVQQPLSSTDINSYYKLNQFVGISLSSGLGFDSNGNLFVGEFNRALVFTPPFTSGMSASSHLLGVFPSGFTFPTVAADRQALIDATALYEPSSFFFMTDGSVGVVDSAYNRILIFDPFSKWPADGTPPKAKSIVGQANTCTQSANQTCKAPNNGNPQPSNSVFNGPQQAVYTGTELFVVDSGNNRVLDLPQQGSTFGPATRVLGQDYFNTNAPNLLEGREFQFQGTFNGNNLSDAAMAIDTSSGTPHLYVSDPYNNRVLGFKDLRKFQNGGKNKADIVLGQADFTTGLINYPSGDPNKPTKSGLFRPVGLQVDANGNLYVADSLNGRVLRFPNPFTYTGAAPEPADLVLGQADFTSKIQDPTASSMAAPYGLAFTPSCNTLSLPCPAPNGLLVSDQADNRVLYIPTTNGTFTAGTDNGKAATIVFGQTSFSSITPGTTLTQMNSPHHISCDTNGYVYVADTGNNRIVVFVDPHAAGTATSGQRASTFVGGFSSPEGIFANPQTGEVWVTNSGAATPSVIRFANYQSILLALGSIDGIAEVSGNFAYATLAVMQDQYGDLFVADNAHRVAIYYPAMNAKNGASFLTLATRPLAPNTIASLFPCDNCTGKQFVADATAFSSYPVPTTLADIQVFVDGTPAPLYYVSGNQINFIVPNGAKTSGFADIQVVQASTGQILGALEAPMYSVAPGAFPYPGGQTGATIYAAAINQDFSINDAAHPAPRGSVVSLYMTGMGNVPGAPPDGVPASAALSAPVPITVLLNGFDVNSSTYGESTQPNHVQYSGINQYPGMWQINVKIPTTVVTTQGVWFAVIANGLSNWDSTSGFKTYIYVK